ncbi:hypothetical protein I3843_05G142400 [Carya illinoinensis]|uniref:Uncharacterized protein n=1 Tax=Carya illinoinensis TaxID=32201 RepID=A0A922EZS6_CARIL|nr:hypothetical protein I3760_05G154800 [Carya illinoinensis]KAG6713431.1 hypothetical protein I3842_05G152400 [Carya illinoinensis]KAG7979660.1 hypothetical protein I3843_05G142400 [Carya illinoinensis]
MTILHLRKRNPARIVLPRRPAPTLKSSLSSPTLSPPTTESLKSPSPSLSSLSTVFENGGNEDHSTRDRRLKQFFEEASGQDFEGQYNLECKTIERACQEVMGCSDTDVAEYLYCSKPQFDSLVNFLCKDLTKACSTKPPPGELFVPKSSKEVEMEKILKSMDVIILSLLYNICLLYKVD